MSEFKMVYALIHPDGGFEGDGFSSTGELGWNLSYDSALAFLADHPDARFVIGVRE